METSRTFNLSDLTSVVEEAEVQEISVIPADAVSERQCLLVVETDKATLELESPISGTVLAVHIEVGQAVSYDTKLFTIACLQLEQEIHLEKIDSTSSGENSKKDISTELVVIGAGPAGYAAAFRAADLGIETVLVDKNAKLGGTCLNSGCIPSKFLLHVVSTMSEASALGEFGVKYETPYIDLKRMMQAKDNVIGTLNSGLETLAKKRNIRVICGSAEFEDADKIKVRTKDLSHHVRFDKAIIATGSKPRKLKEINIENSRIKYSEQALNIQYIPDQLLVIGGGVIGLELSSVYHGLGSNVTVIEASDKFLGILDDDVVAPLLDKYRNSFQCLMTNTVLEDVMAGSSMLSVKLKQGKNHISTEFDSILVVTGREPSTSKLNLEAANISADQYGCIKVDDMYRTSVQNIFAIGDVIGNPMLAHKGSYEGRLVAEICAGGNVTPEKKTMPFVVYTEPEVAWVGMSEEQALANFRDVDTVKLPWSANGRALSQGCSHGLTKLVIDKGTKTLIGGGLVGPNAGEMIAELALVIEHKITIQQLASLIHPHPTLSETIGVCAEMYLNEAVEVLNVS